MIEYKEQYAKRLAEEHKKIDPKQRAMLYDIACYMEAKYGVNLIVTCFDRTVKENRDAGGRRYSAHLSHIFFTVCPRCFGMEVERLDAGSVCLNCGYVGYPCRATDIRVHNLKDYMIVDLVGDKKSQGYIKHVWGTLFHCVVHGKGANRHIHTNINYGWRTMRYEAKEEK